MVNVATVQFNFGKDFDAALNASLSEAVKRRQDRIRRKVKTRLKSIINRYIKGSPVSKSILGGGGNPENSLQAELGLTDEAAITGINKLIQIVQDSMKVSVKAVGSRSSGISRIGVPGLSSNEIEKGINFSIADFSYISNGFNPESGGIKSRKIEWMRLVLNPNTGILDQAFPDIRKPQNFNNISSYWKIVRGNDAEELMRRSSGFRASNRRPKSRSGFAIMALGGTFPYRVPPILLPRGSGKNFLDEVLRSRGFQREVREAIQEVVQEEFRR